MKKIFTISLVSVVFLLSGCATYSQHPNAIGGAAVGGAVGAAVTGNPAGAAAGAAIGAGVGAMADDMYNPRGVRGRPGYGGHRYGRVDPCQPHDASALMDWAEELEGGQYHKRNARQSVSPDGRVQCSSSESAGSSYGTRRSGGSYDPHYGSRLDGSPNDPRYQIRR